ncbi:MAG: hypothetical protein LHV68_08100 [Elusimicrobia bacterium]|nr:hypothetical protein [Candidatus Liberimonas magnetica]
MEYTKKHKILIAKYLKNAGMIKEARKILTTDKYNFKISNAIRDAAEKTRIGIGRSPALLDAVRRYENRSCAIFEECPLPRCEGGVWCSIYNLGGSHGQTGENYRYLAKSAVLVPLRKRREIMFQMLEHKTGHKFKK